MASLDPPEVRVLWFTITENKRTVRDLTPRDTQLPTAAAFGKLVVHDTRDSVQRLQAAHIWQRLHLWAMAPGYSDAAAEPGGRAG